ncbi:MAG: protein phosphatase 2C domain-containing protein [Chryseobacterium sp.]|jgi:serine/threonine protein phosphatase PrpC|uniref:PP2C family serine/threonine-protein phosphatase n=1 Tax=Chryseobacterium sp. TaxID=1871047 RepID=UPI00282059B5|nr:PP2C family serine/threonine-protein phosphatase [Chryseobacterium sp.]MDR2236341.1 protein phosphatase 2C domain-containing protein [Chryseobacterium sp.]
MGIFFNNGDRKKENNRPGNEETRQDALIRKQKEEFRDSHLVLKNASARQFYEFSFDMDDFPDIRIKNILHLEETGLKFEDHKIAGMPAAGNVYDLDIEFYHTKDEKNTCVKRIQLYVNADPKDLWKNIPADINDRFYKADEVSFKGAFLDKKIVAASKRGRSHAHEGKFREDDFAVNELSEGWSIVSVSDGAGSAEMAREGSRLAVHSINTFFSSEEILNELETDINVVYQASSGIHAEAEQNILRLLNRSVEYVHQVLDETAKKNSLSIKDFHATLIFALVKKFDFGYIFLTFGVGDCPVNLISPDFSEVKLLNRMDVGEFSGGTRFITMEEIFSEQLSSRFGMTRVKDFSYLVLMTDGIYDPKFMTENKLVDLESWKKFFNDLDGNNDDCARVDFINDKDIDRQLLEWTDFWSRGNHDDRTLVIIY